MENRKSSVAVDEYGNVIIETAEENGTQNQEQEESGETTETENEIPE